MNNTLYNLEYLSLSEKERKQRIVSLRNQFSVGKVSLAELNNSNNNGIITNEEYDSIIED